MLTASEKTDEALTDAKFAGDYPLRKMRFADIGDLLMCEFAPSVFLAAGPRPVAILVIHVFLLRTGINVARVAASWVSAFVVSLRAFFCENSTIKREGDPMRQPWICTNHESTVSRLVF